LRSVVPGARVVLARLGVDTDVPSSTAPEPDLVVAVGSLQETKGHHVLIDAVALLARRDVRVRCVIVGEGGMRRRLEEQVARLGLTDRVTLPGHLSRGEALALMARASVVALASMQSADEGVDGIPIALMEAMARGRPCVSTRVSGIPELVLDGQTGLLVEEHDPGALAGALERVLGDPALAARLGSRGRQHVKEHFDRAACLSQAVGILGPLATVRSKPPRGARAASTPCT
jgi:glycosyltransferase involved in cell wall biosynthesis